MKTRFIIAVFLSGACLALSMVPTACLGQSAALPAPNPALPDISSSVLRLLVAFAVVLALFFAGVWLFRNGSRIMRHSASRKLKVIEARSLGSRHALYVISCEEQRMLIAASPNGVTLLGRLPPAKENADIAPAPISFAQLFQKMFRPQ